MLNGRYQDSPGRNAAAIVRAVRRGWSVLSLVVFACSSDPVAPLTERDGGTLVDPRDAGVVVRDAGEAVTDAGGSMDAGDATDAGIWPDEFTLGPADREAPLLVPSDYDGTALPLIILLHGYTVTGAIQDQYFGLSRIMDDRRFHLILPDGTREPLPAMNRFWNATPACCDIARTGVDDSSYLFGLIEEAKTKVSVSKVYAVGHSNGGFMSYRLACDDSEAIDAVASLAGATFIDEDDCNATTPVSVLQIHGTTDTTILYSGGNTGVGAYPGAEETVRRWASRAGCDTQSSESGPDIDLDTVVPGAETEVVRYRAGCAPGTEAELWRMVGAGHIPTLSQDFSDRVVDWLFAH